MCHIIDDSASKEKLKTIIEEKQVILIAPGRS